MEIEERRDYGIAWNTLSKRKNIYLNCKTPSPVNIYYIVTLKID
jgi:hypothetical protein